MYPYIYLKWAPNCNSVSVKKDNNYKYLTSNTNFDIWRPVQITWTLTTDQKHCFSEYWSSSTIIKVPLANSFLMTSRLVSSSPTLSQVLHEISSHSAWPVALTRQSSQHTSERKPFLALKEKLKQKFSCFASLTDIMYLLHTSFS